MVNVARRLLKRALDEHLMEMRKSAFIPMGSAAEKTGAQAPGPGGAPVDPAMGGAPMDPAMGGMPPMDPMAAMGGAPPMDPAMGGAPPMDPMAAMGGAPPMDPMAAMGGAPMDMGLPPLPEGEMPLPEGEGEGGEGVTMEDAEIVDQVTERTLDIVRQTLEMVGKTKTPKPEEAPATEGPPPPPPEAAPGPITGEPGFNPADFGGGAVKTSAVIIGDALKKVAAQAGAGILAQEELRNPPAVPVGPGPRPNVHSSTQQARDWGAQQQSHQMKLKAQQRRQAALEGRAAAFKAKRTAPVGAATGGAPVSGGVGPLPPDWIAKRQAEAKAIK